MENKKMPSNKEGKKLNTEAQNHTIHRLPKQLLDKATKRANSLFWRYTNAYEFLIGRRDHHSGLIKGYLELIRTYEQRIDQHIASAESFEKQAYEYLPLMRLAWSERLKLEEQGGYDVSQN